LKWKANCFAIQKRKKQTCAAADFRSTRFDKQISAAACPEAKENRRVRGLMHPHV